MLLHKETLLNAKNLLAFSAGGDSTALLFLLLENNISFDIAIVDYGLREQSKLEVAYAQELAKKYKFNCFVLNTKKIIKNFEAQAREIRYDFFEALIKEHHYQNLLTAHHLGDRLEWMLMQFCKGAGCPELTGMKHHVKRQGYELVRPLLHVDKPELIEYLNTRGISYFEDATNSDQKYKRNEFRHKYATPLLEKYKSGIVKSFQYLDEDSSSLVQEIQIHKINQFAYFKSSPNTRSTIFTIDKYLKSQAHIITAKERALLKSQESVVLGRKYIVSQTPTYTFIAPFLEVSSMSKEFKEKMRLLKVTPKLRAYLSTDEDTVLFLSSLLQ